LSVLHIGSRTFRIALAALGFMAAAQAGGAAAHQSLTIGARIITSCRMSGNAAIATELTVRCTGNSRVQVTRAFLDAGGLTVLF
jgi:hypothetical protein